MKKCSMITLVLVLMLALFFSGCKQQDADEIELGTVATPSPAAISGAIEAPDEATRPEGDGMLTPLEEGLDSAEESDTTPANVGASPDASGQASATASPHVPSDPSIDWDEISGVYFCTIDEWFDKNGGLYLKISEINYGYEEYPAVNHLGMSYMDAKLVVYDEPKAQFTVVIDGDTTIYYVDPANPMVSGGNGYLTLSTFKNNYLGKTYSGDGRPYIFELRLYDGLVDSIGLWDEYYMSIYTDPYDVGSNSSSAVNNGSVLLPGSNSSSKEQGGTDLFQNR